MPLKIGTCSWNCDSWVYKMPAIREVEEYAELFGHFLERLEPMKGRWARSSSTKPGSPSWPDRMYPMS